MQTQLTVLWKTQKNVKDRVNERLALFRFLFLFLWNICLLYSYEYFLPQLAPVWWRKRSQQRRFWNAFTKLWVTYYPTAGFVRPIRVPLNNVIYVTTAWTCPRCQDDVRLRGDTPIQLYFPPSASRDGSSGRANSHSFCNVQKINCSEAITIVRFISLYLRPPDAYFNTRLGTKLSTYTL